MVCHDGLRVQHLNQGLNGIKDIKLFGRQDEFISQAGMVLSERIRLLDFALDNALWSS